jgi:hypothetical protein
MLPKPEHDLRNRMKNNIYDCYECKFFNSDACVHCSLGSRFTNFGTDEICKCSEKVKCDYCENILYQDKD